MYSIIQHSEIMQAEHRNYASKTHTDFNKSNKCTPFFRFRLSRILSSPNIRILAFLNFLVKFAYLS